MTKELHYTKHESAIVDDGAQIGNGCRVWHFVHVCAGATIGESCSLGQNVFVSDQVVIGNNVKIQNNVSVYDNVTLEDDVFCGPSMVFTNVYNPRSAVSRKDQYRDTLVRRGATLGANCTIVCGVKYRSVFIRRRRLCSKSRRSRFRSGSRGSNATGRMDEPVWGAIAATSFRRCRGYLCAYRRKIYLK